MRHGYSTNAVRWVDVENARESAEVGDLDGAIETAGRRSTSSTDQVT
jgi:hypothetical protein